jgi:thiol:disulfide interchange protein
VAPIAGLEGRIVWSDFAPGLDRARREGRPVLLTFVTSWCPFCKRMDRGTWKAPRVRERLTDLVTVRVDAEDSHGRGGPPGTELADRFGVRAFPTQVLLGPDGIVLSRADGYQEPDELVAWLDAGLAARGAGATASASSRGRP